MPMLSGTTVPPHPATGGTRVPVAGSKSNGLGGAEARGAHINDSRKFNPATGRALTQTNSATLRAGYQSQAAQQLARVYASNGGNAVNAGRAGFPPAIGFGNLPPDVHMGLYVQGWQPTT